MTTAGKRRTALLIDADNVSTAVVAEVLARLAHHHLQHRRAYGSVQKAIEYAELSRAHAIRFLPSSFEGPNATDLALAIDAIELVLREPVEEVVLVSSDRDFAPLIVRLRELGCRVTGYGQQGKSASNIERDYLRVYDAFEVIGIDKGRGARTPRPKDSEQPAPREAERSAPREAEMSPAKPAPAPKAARKRKAAAKALPPAPPPKPFPDAVQQVLAAYPALQGGEAVRLNGVSAALREQAVLKKNGKPSAYFKKLGRYFEMLPADKPETVRYLGPG